MMFFLYKYNSSNEYAKTNQLFDGSNTMHKLWPKIPQVTCKPGEILHETVSHLMHLHLFACGYATVIH